MSTASAASPTASEPKAPFTLVNVVYHGMMGMRAAAIVTVNIDGRHESAESHGDGPIDAAYKAIQKIVPHNGATFMISHVENAKQSEGSGGVAHVRADFLIGGTTIVEANAPAAAPATPLKKSRRDIGSAVFELIGKYNQHHLP